MGYLPSGMKSLALLAEEWISASHPVGLLRQLKPRLTSVYLELTSRRSIAGHIWQSTFGICYQQRVFRSGVVLSKTFQAECVSQLSILSSATSVRSDSCETQDPTRGTSAHMTFHCYLLVISRKFLTSIVPSVKVVLLSHVNHKLRERHILIDPVGPDSRLLVLPLVTHVVA